MTRPEPFNEPICAKLAALGQDHIYLPAASLVPVSSPKRLTTEMVMFLSPASVLYAPMLQHVKYAFAVGPKTARAVETRFGITCHYPIKGAFSVHGLCQDALFKSCMQKMQHVSILGAEGTEQKRFESLRDGMTVSFIATHRLQPMTKRPAMPLAEAGEIWFTSFKLMQLFCAYYIDTLKLKNLLSYDIVVPNAQCVDLAQTIGFHRSVDLIDQPTDATFLARLKD